MKNYLTIGILVTSTLLAGASLADSGKADRINEARSYPGENAESRFLSSDSHRKLVQLVQRAHTAKASDDAALKEKLHDQLHEELRLHASR